MKRVLIIDDDPLYRKVMAEVLQKHDWQVMEAGEGEASGGNFDLAGTVAPRRGGTQIGRRRGVGDGVLK